MKIPCFKVLGSKNFEQHRCTIKDSLIQGEIYECMYCISINDFQLDRSYCTLEVYLFQEVLVNNLTTESERHNVNGY